jgi:hypothetical protein
MLPGPGGRTRVEQWPRPQTDEHLAGRSSTTEPHTLEALPEPPERRASDRQRSTSRPGSPVRTVVRATLNGGTRGLWDVLRRGTSWRWRRARRALRRVVARKRPNRSLSAHDIEPAVQGIEATTLEPQPGSSVDAPKVCVVVTSFNRSELLPIALRSIQLQDLAEFECVVVDDSSTDDSVSVAQAFAAADPRFRVVVHDERRGLAAARNTGIAVSRAPLVCFLDDDDFLLAGSLSARLAAMVEQPDDIVGSYGDWLNVDPGVGLEAFRPDRKCVVRGTVWTATLRAGAPFIATAPVIRTEILRQVGGFDETFERAEDTELWFRLARLGYRFADARHIVVAYRRTPNSLVLGAPVTQLEALLEVFRRADQLAPAISDRGPMPSVEPLSVVALNDSRRLQLLRYVGLIAARDLELAVETGCRELLPAVRRTLDPVAGGKRLASYVAPRLGIHDPSEVANVQATMTTLIERLMPAVPTTWRSPVEPRAWSTRVAGRMAHVGPPPSFLPEAGLLDAVDGALVLVAEARYHVDELGPLGDVLASRGVKVCYMTAPRTVPLALAELGRYARVVAPFDIDAVRKARAVVVLNDWGKARALVEAANEAGVATFAKVEGVQDFDDLESTWERRPYRTAQYILGQGQNDVDALPDKDVFVVGNSRLERIWSLPPVTPGAHALINLNFTYNVLTDQRDGWLASVADALEHIAMEGVVSTHPAERGSSDRLPVADKPFRHEITKAGVLISRFSTVPFEAMARGVPFVYHNPHRELMPAFKHPNGAFPVSTDSESLAKALTTVRDWTDDYRERSSGFFHRQVDIDPFRSSAARACEVIRTLTAG